jgi:hypothetical protein
MNQASFRTYIPLLLVLFLSGLPTVIQAQVPFPESGPVFRDDLLPRIHLYLPKDSLDKMYLNPMSDAETPIRFIFESGDIKDTLENVGLRFRGNTSRMSAKKSFSLSFNTFITKGSFYGLEKMDLNGEHNDPSVIRSKLSWDLYRSIGIPAPRANHILLYINDVFWGVYINVEQVDEEFAKLRFGNKKGNLYKCLYPADLTYRSKNPGDYKYMSGTRRVYELKTNETADDYTDLSEFIDILNNTPLSSLPTELEKVLNVETLLKVMVSDVFVGNWDGPFYNKNNFYLYKNTATAKFELIPYDVDNTFGIDWFNIDWASRSVYQWAPQSEPRPLYSRILAIPAYRKEYTRLFHAFLNSLDDGHLISRIGTLKEMYGPYIATDPYYRRDYGWTTGDFQTSFNNRLTASHVKVGLIPYIQARTSIARSQLDALTWIEDPTAEAAIHVYPNPVSDYLVIEQGNPEVRYDIIGSNGSIVKRGILNAGCSKINITDITQGIYYLMVTLPKNGSLTKRIVVLH